MEDVFHVGEMMWQRGIDELTALGIDKEMWVMGWSRRIASGDAVAIVVEHLSYRVGEFRYVGLEPETVAILGCDWEEAGICSTAFQASFHFEGDGVGRAVTRAIRKHIPALMKKHGIYLAQIISLCVDPKAPKWFRLLGFEEDKDFRGMRFGKYRSRRFLRRA